MLMPVPCPWPHYHHHHHHHYQIKHFEHAWLKESWATYMECCWLEVSEEGDDAFLYQVRNGASAWAGLSFLSNPPHADLGMLNPIPPHTHTHTHTIATHTGH